MAVMSPFAQRYTLTGIGSQRVVQSSPAHAIECAGRGWNGGTFGGQRVFRWPMQNYRQLSVWRKAHAVVLNIHRTAEAIPRRNGGNIGNQMIRAAMSIAANIVEGSSRGSDQDFAKFVQIAIGSASELEYHLHVAADLGLIPPEEFAARGPEVVEVRKMLIGLKKRLNAPLPQQAR